MPADPATQFISSRVVQHNGLALLLRALTLAKRTVG
jgi:hypothetical protein